MAVSKVSGDARDDRYEVRRDNPPGGRYQKVVSGRAAERHETQVRTGVPQIVIDEVTGHLPPGSVTMLKSWST